MNNKTDIYNHIINNPNTYSVFKLGADWCGPCRRIAPTFKHLMSNYKNTQVFDVNIDDPENDPDNSIQEMMDELGLKKIPHFFICHNGEMIANIQTSSPDTLESFFNEYLGK